MPFDITRLPNNKKARVVAMLLEGRGDGHERITGPVAIDAWRRGGKLVVSGHHAEGYFEMGNQHTEFLRGEPDIQIGWDDHYAPNYGDGSGRATGVAVVGAVLKGETDEAAIARLRHDVPDIRGRWAAHREAEVAKFDGMRRALQEGARDGFGLGVPMRFR